MVVTANYRLGALGFLVTTSSSSSASSEDDGYDLTGNFGLMDQKAAMEWVAGNAVAFGGDPDSVTLFGQSAGAMSVGLHFVSPPMFQSGLFHKVIMER
jgi:para-nitrobenzyl esterase